MAKVHERPRKYASGASTEPTNPINRTSHREDFLISMIFIKQGINHQYYRRKKASEDATCRKLNDADKTFPTIVSTAHIAPANTPKRSPKIF